MQPSTQPPVGNTRQRLLQAALHAFGHHDYDAVGTREIVDAAGANVAAISYHFGGKRGLYLASAEFLGDRLRTGMQSWIDRVEAEISDATPDRCRQLLHDFMQGFAEDLLQGDLSEDAPGFIFREQNHPSEAFEILFERLFEPMHRSVSQLVGRIRGLKPDYPETVLVSHALIGQVIAFRAGRTTVMRRLGIQRYGEADSRLIGGLLAALTTAALDYTLTAPLSETHHE